MAVGGEVRGLGVEVVGVLDDPGDDAVGVGDEVAAGERPALAVVGDHRDAGRAVGVRHRRARERRGDARDGIRRRPVGVGAAERGLPVVVEPVVLEEDVLLRRLRAHRRQVQPSRGAERLVAVSDAVTVGVRHVRVRARLRGVDEGTRAVLDGVRQPVTVGVRGGHAREPRACTPTRRRRVRARDPPDDPIAPDVPAPLVRRVPRRHRNRVRRRRRQTDQHATRRRRRDRTDRAPVHLQRVRRDLLAVVVLHRRRPRHRHQRTQRHERQRRPVREVRRTRRDEEHEDAEDPRELH